MESPVVVDKPPEYHGNTNGNDLERGVSGYGLLPSNRELRDSIPATSELTNKFLRQIKPHALRLKGHVKLPTSNGVFGLAKVAVCSPGPH
ncbi:hypothetical protein EVAR_23617_1 [Eumeta japonica]|uniref:Uncharacterized protein n=1 Tax=Eumeta variegata TaxID=151549 RepID=A0A4C1X1I6_EUMVA|nr:hypothetical protein EVAR_23617_1 [Eumeta japonica]